MLGEAGLRSCCVRRPLQMKPLTELKVFAGTLQVDAGCCAANLEQRRWWVSLPQQKPPAFLMLNADTDDNSGLPDLVQG